MGKEMVQFLQQYEVYKIASELTAEFFPTVFPSRMEDRDRLSGFKAYLKEVEAHPEEAEVANYGALVELHRYLKPKRKWPWTDLETLNIFYAVEPSCEMFYDFLETADVRIGSNDSDMIFRFLFEQQIFDRRVLSFLFRVYKLHLPDLTEPFELEAGTDAALSDEEMMEVRRVMRNQAYGDLHDEDDIDIDFEREYSIELSSDEELETLGDALGEEIEEEPSEEYPEETAEEEDAFEIYLYEDIVEIDVEVENDDDLESEEALDDRKTEESVPSASAKTEKAVGAPGQKGASPKQRTKKTAGSSRRETTGRPSKKESASGEKATGSSKRQKGAASPKAPAEPKKAASKTAAKKADEPARSGKKDTASAKPKTTGAKSRAKRKSQ